MIRECAQCGQEFEARGKGKAYFCEECRKQRKARARALSELSDFRANIKGRSLPMSWNDKKNYDAVLRKRQPNGKLEEYKPCPNFNSESISCSICPAEAWKFKACGRSK